jgi:hypothetical protein
MIWINIGDKSYQVAGINISIKGDNSELWAERPNGKTVKLATGTEEEIYLHKEAIDYTVGQGLTTYTIN